MLQECLKFGESLPFALSICGYLMIYLEIDKTSGEKIIKESIRKVIEFNNISEESLIELSALYPILKNICKFINV
jgi:hypothetical protein